MMSRVGDSTAAAREEGREQREERRQKRGDRCLARPRRQGEERREEREERREKREKRRDKREDRRQTPRGRQRSPNEAARGGPTLFLAMPPAGRTPQKTLKSFQSVFPKDRSPFSSPDGSRWRPRSEKRRCSLRSLANRPTKNLGSL